MQKKIWRFCYNICSVHCSSPSSLCASSVRVSTLATPIIGAPDKQINWNFQKPQSHCMCYRTPFEQNTFYNSIKSYLPSGVNDYQVKLRRKTSSPLLHAGLQSGTTTRNSLEGTQQGKQDHFQLGHHKISHCNNFTYKTLTNIKQGEQISNTINQDYTHGLKSPCHSASARRDWPSRENGAAP